MHAVIAFGLALPSLSMAAAPVPAELASTLVRQLRIDVAEMRECRPPQGLPVDVQPLDLAAADAPAYLLTSIASCECGQVNCSQWIYRRSGEGFTQVLETDGYRLSVLRTRHHGLFDVESEARGSAAAIDRRRYAFDGARYRASVDTVEDTRSGAQAATGRRVRFAKGRTEAVLSGHARFGFADRWVVGARQGQTMHLSLPSEPGVSVVVIAPKTGERVESSGHGPRGDRVLPASGDYTIVVDAEANEPVAYRLDLAIDNP